MSQPKIWVPPRVDKEAKFFCRACGTRFITEKAMENHVVRTCQVDTDELRARRRDPLDTFYGDGPDPEWAAYNAALERAGINPEVQYNRGRKSGIRRASES